MSDSFIKDWIDAEQKKLKLERGRFDDSIFKPDDLALLNHQKKSPYIQWSNKFIWKRLKDLYPRSKVLQSNNYHSKRERLMNKK